MREGFWRRNHDPPLKCSDSSRRSTSLFRRDGVGKGRFPSAGFISGPLAASWGLSALFSLLSLGHGTPSICSESSWRPFALFPLLSSLFSLRSAIPPEDAERARPWRLHMREGFWRGGTVSERVGSPLAASFRDLWRPLGVSLLSSLFSLLCALFSLCSLPSSLAAAHFSDRTSHLPLRSLHQAIDVAPNCFDPLRLPPWPGGMREAIKSGHRALGATVGAVW